MFNHHLLFLAVLIQSIETCDIWKASECPKPPTADDEEIFKYDLYTREQLFRFCDQGKKYAECVNKRLHCCDLQSEHSGALTAFEVALEQNGWRLGKYCAGLGASTIIQYKCKTTTSSPLKTTTTTSSTTTTIPSCAVDEASKECNQILDDRLRFDVTWTVHEKIHWCKSATKYVRCANRHVSNCSIIDVQDDVEQLTNFIDYLVRQANRHCQGGFLGCDELAETDVRCHQGPHQFYKGEAFDSAAPHVSLVYVSLLCSIVLALNVLFHLYSEEMCVY